MSYVSGAGGCEEADRSPSTTALVAPGHQCAQIKSEDVEEVSGSEYLELLSVIQSLAWSQPSMMRFGCSHDPRHADSALFPQLFYTDNPNVDEVEDGVGEEDAINTQEPQEGSCEVHAESLEVIKRVPVDTDAPPSVVHYIPHCSVGQDDHRVRVREAVGFDFPPVMTQHIEAMVHRHWEEWRAKGLISDHDEMESVFHSIVVDAHVYLTRVVRAYIRSVKSRRGPSSIVPETIYRRAMNNVRKVVSEVERELYKERVAKLSPDRSTGKEGLCTSTQERQSGTPVYKAKTSQLNHDKSMGKKRSNTSTQERQAGAHVYKASQVSHDRSKEGKEIWCGSTQESKLGVQAPRIVDALPRRSTRAKATRISYEELEDFTDEEQ